MKSVHPLTRKFAAAAAVGAAMTLGLSACDRRPDGQMSDRAAADATKQSADLGAAMNDTAITAQVQGRLSTDTRTQPASISVETNNGVVTLTGTSPTAQGKSAAEDLARMVPDVKGVDNRIEAPNAMQEMAGNVEDATAQAGDSIDDTWITTKVKSALLVDTQTKGSKINVETEEGVVSLSGTAQTDAERNRAVEIAAATEGVRSVDDSALTVVR